jgi:3-methyladenine DNA glycosylase AlkD
MKYEEIIKKLKSLSNPENVAGMTRFGINPKYALGINIPVLRRMAKDVCKDPQYKKNPEKLHKLAQDLWDSKIHEVRILAGMIDVSELVTDAQMDNWVKDFNSWDLCDQVISSLFDKTPFAYQKAFEWSKRKEEFEKRAGFVMMAVLSVHDKNPPDRRSSGPGVAPDAKFEKFFPVIKREATDERNFVKKAVNWALRQIGKRNTHLRNKAISLSKELIDSKNITAKWIGSDALRELSKDKV